MIDTNHVPAVVKALLAAELSPATAQWRDLDAAENDSQQRYGYPLVEVEFPGADLEAQEYGDPGGNIWAENAAFMVHVHVKRGTGDMTQARQVMDQVVSIFAGRTVDGVHFLGALAQHVDDGTGQTRGVSRAIEYRYEFLHR